LPAVTDSVTELSRPMDSLDKGDRDIWIRCLWMFQPSAIVSNSTNTSKHPVIKTLVFWSKTTARMGAIAIPNANKI
jgi:hypothetical protein